MYERIIQILELLCFTEKGKFYSAEIDLANFGKMADRQSFSFNHFRINCITYFNLILSFVFSVVSLNMIEYIFKIMIDETLVFFLACTVIINDVEVKEDNIKNKIFLLVKSNFNRKS